MSIRVTRDSNIVTSYYEYPVGYEPVTEHKRATNNRESNNMSITL